MTPTADYVRQLEDACLILWGDNDQVALRQDFPALMDFLSHLHHSIEHEQAITRTNVWVPWATPNDSLGTV